MTAAEKLKLVANPPCKVVMTSEEYHSHSAIGSTSLKHVLRSPAHYLHAKENPADKPAFNFGRAAHMALLEPNVFAETVVVMPEFWGLTKKGEKTNSPNCTEVKEQREKWLLQNHGNTIVSAEEKADILLMAKALSKHKTARGLLTGGAAEESYFWTDEDTGVLCKCRPDFMRDGNIVVDIKTTSDASQATFQKDITNLKYHMQAAHYLAGASAVVGQTFDTFIIIAVEKSAPYGVQVFQLDERTLEKGLELRNRALARLAECQKQNAYPAYADEIVIANIMPWGWEE